MNSNLVANIEAQETSQTGSTLDLSLIGKGKEFRKLHSYVASLFILLLVVRLFLFTYILLLTVYILLSIVYITIYTTTIYTTTSILLYYIL